MSVADLPIITILRRFLSAPVAMFVRFSDDADEVWEPFLDDARS